jgi:hypothetical protein
MHMVVRAGAIPDYGQPILPVAIVTIALSALFVSLRVWSRAVILRIWALEDWLLICGWVCAIGVCAGNIVCESLC